MTRRSDRTDAWIGTGANMNDTPAAGRRQQSIRRTNRLTILRELHLTGPTSRSELVQRTGLTRSAIGSLIGDLVELGLVSESGSAPRSGPGRPSSLVEPSNQQVVLAVDLMVDSIGVAVVALGGSVLRSTRKPRRRAHQAPEQAVEEALKLIDRMTATLDDSTRVVGIGVAVPGLISQPDHQVLLAPNLGWANADIAPLFLERLGNLPIVIANEADLGALAESRRGAAVGYDHVLYLSAEVGVGGGIISNGTLMTGTGGFAGEIGHVPVHPTGKKCGCGATGCFETEVGEHALLQRCGRPIEGGREAIDDLLQAAAAGDQAVLDGLDEHASWLAIGLTGVIHMLNLDVVVLGGLLGELMPQMQERVRSDLAARLLPAMQDTQVVAAALGDEAVLIGAAERIWDLVIDQLVTDAAV